MGCIPFTKQPCQFARPYDCGCDASPGGLALIVFVVNLMSRSAKKEGFGSERYLKLRYWLLRSPAWQSLPGRARALYIDIAMRYNGSNNGRISYSVREGAAALHVTKDSIGRTLKLLQERGFIVCTKVAYFTVKTTREASEWRLTEYDDDLTHQHAAKSFMSWQPGEPDTNEGLRFRRRSDRRDRTVRPQGPHGPTRRTINPKIRPNGPVTGTVEAINPVPTVRSEGHLYLPGTGYELAERLRWSIPSFRELTDRQELRVARSDIAIAEIAARRRKLQAAH